MVEEHLIEPDLEFVQQIMKLGGKSLKKCYQCATCSVVCNSSPDNRPFPRKEMIWAQWGLKDRLVNDPDVWLCHQCNDCTIRCPREARPAEVLAAIRNYIFLHYAFPKFLGKAVSEAKYLPLLFAVPVLFLWAVLSLSGNLTLPAGTIVFSDFIPHTYIDIGFIAVGFFVLSSMAVGAQKFWKDLKLPPPSPPLKGGDGGGFSENGNSYAINVNFERRENSADVKESLWTVLVEILKHSRFRDCEANPIRYYAHLAIFYGFMGLFLTTALVFLGIVLLGIHPPLPQYSPVKILGNLSALAFFGGLTVVLYQRLAGKDSVGNSTYQDWFFIGMLYVTAITGILTEVTRMASMAALAYPLYTIHLIFIFVLLASLPYSKFAHLVYRSVAMVYAKRSGRETVYPDRLLQKSQNVIPNEWEESCNPSIDQDFSRSLP